MKTKNKYVPNSILPDGAVLLNRAVRKKVGSWAEMDYDAKCERLGLTWWRARGGFGQSMPGHGYHPREDWTAELPCGCLSVSNDDWDGSASFGYDHKTLYASFDAAVIGETKAFLEDAERDAACIRHSLKTHEATVRIISSAIGLAIFQESKSP